MTQSGSLYFTNLKYRIPHLWFCTQGEFQKPRRSVFNGCLAELYGGAHRALELSALVGNFINSFKSHRIVCACEVDESFNSALEP